MKITASLKKSVEGATWQQVVGALAEGMHNISYVERTEGPLDDFLRERNLKRGEVVFMATHSLGGRAWTPSKEDLSVPFYPDIIGGGWDILSEEDVTRIWLGSATSASEVTAERQLNGLWTVTLEVPIIEGGDPYEGVYWGNFHSVFYKALVL